MGASIYIYIYSWLKFQRDVIATAYHSKCGDADSLILVLISTDVKTASLASCHESYLKRMSLALTNNLSFTLVRHPKRLTSVVVFYLAPNGPRDAVIPCRIRRSPQTATFASNASEVHLQTSIRRQFLPDLHGRSEFWPCDMVRRPVVGHFGVFLVPQALRLSGVGVSAAWDQAYLLTGFYTNPTTYPNVGCTACKVHRCSCYHRHRKTVLRFLVG